MKATPSASYSITLRVEHPRQPGVLGQVFTTIGEEEGMVGAVDIVRVQEKRAVRDITVDARDSEHAQQVSDAIDELEDIRVISFSDRTFLVHQGAR